MKAYTNHIHNSDLHYRVVETKKQVRIGITRGQALICAAAFAFFFYILSGFVFASEGPTGQQPAALQVKEVTVQPGDSLWKLAVRYHEKTGMGVQELVDLLMEMNGLDDAIIYPGQNLRIPVKL